MEVERTFLMKPSSLWAFSRSTVGGSCRGRYPSTGYVEGGSRNNQEQKEKEEKEELLGQPAAGEGYLRGLLPKLKATDSLKDRLMAGK